MDVEAARAAEAAVEAEEEEEEEEEEVEERRLAMAAAMSKSCGVWVGVQRRSEGQCECRMECGIKRSERDDTCYVDCGSLLGGMMADGDPRARCCGQRRDASAPTDHTDHTA